jgi:hypothetical protein
MDLISIKRRRACGAYRRKRCIFLSYVAGGRELCWRNACCATSRIKKLSYCVLGDGCVECWFYVFDSLWTLKRKVFQ